MGNLSMHPALSRKIIPTVHTKGDHSVYLFAILAAVALNSDITLISVL